MQTDGLSPFSWPDAFPEVWQAGGFDAVLANPPFANAIEDGSRLSVGERRYAQTQYGPFAAGAGDLCLLFWGRTLLHLLRPGGRYGFIAPGAILADSREWRRWVHERWRPTDLLVFPLHAFPGARVTTVGVCGEQGQSRFVRVVDERSDPPRCRRVCWPPDLHTWSEAVLPARSRPATSLVLGSLPVAIHAGCATSTAYRLAAHVSDASGGERLLTSGLIDRYVCYWGVHRARFLGAVYSAPVWPDESSSPGDVRRALLRQRCPKILLAGLASVPEAWLDAAGSYAGVVSTWVVCADDTEFLPALLTLLNSATFARAYLDRYGTRSMNGWQVTFGKPALLQTPVPPSLANIWSGNDLAGPCAKLGRALQSLALDDPRRPAGDLAAHLYAGRWYGQTDRQTLEDYQWWCERSGAPVVRIEPRRLEALTAELCGAACETGAA